MTEAGILIGAPDWARGPQKCQNFQILVKNSISFYRRPYEGGLVPQGIVFGPLLFSIKMSASIFVLSLQYAEDDEDLDDEELERRKSKKKGGKKRGTKNTIFDVSTLKSCVNAPRVCSRDFRLSCLPSTNIINVNGTAPIFIPLLLQVFEPHELERGHFTDLDQEIRLTDMPERFQLRSLPVTPLDEGEVEEEAKWIFKVR